MKRRQQVERPRIIEAISEARSHGDLSENAEYHAAKEAQGLNEGRIAELEDMIARAEVIDVTKLSGETIKFGATVKLIDEDTEEKKTYQIVGEHEADVQVRPGLDHLADRPRADRQEERRHGRGERRPAAARATRSSRCASADRQSVIRAGLGLAAAAAADPSRPPAGARAGLRHPGRVGGRSGRWRPAASNGFAEALGAAVHRQFLAQFGDRITGDHRAPC